MLFRSAAVILLCLIPLVAQTFNRRNIRKEEAFIKELIENGPDTMADFVNATKAMDAGRFAEAIPLFDKVLKANQFFPPVLRRLGLCYIFVGYRKEGLTLLEAAVERERTPDNLAALAQGLMGAPQKEGSPAEKQRALRLAKEASVLYTRRDDPNYLAQLARVAMQVDEELELREATRQLVVRYPLAVESHYFAAVVARLDGDYERMRIELDSAKKLGLPDEMTYTVMRPSTRNKWLYLAGLAIALAVGAGGFLFIRGAHRTPA